MTSLSFRNDQLQPGDSGKAGQRFPSLLTLAASRLANVKLAAVSDTITRNEAIFFYSESIEIAVCARGMFKTYLLKE